MRPGTIERTAVLAAALAVTAAWASSSAAQSAGLVTRTSATSGGIEGDLFSGQATVSADGRYVAFESAAANLVPGDTNDDSDVFVHDAVTGVLERVSLTWNGMEARASSKCPALSADGRYVAFRSIAWNMYPGGANLGNGVWNVYLRDRQAGTTTRITTSFDGGDPDSDSECPSISADGRRIAFASKARNLVRRDTNRRYDVFLFDVVKQKTKLISKTADGGTANDDSRGPVISGDGRTVAFSSRATNLAGAEQPPVPQFDHVSHVFARDLTTGTTELIDVPPLQPGEHPNGPAFGVALSYDARKIAFGSSASNLVNPPPSARLYDRLVYVRDRDTGKTVLASRENVAFGDCSLEPGTGRCDPGDSWLPSISADGRWVGFTSYSMRLLPMSFSHAPQIYLFDTLGGRVRRISVDATGWEAGCTGESALSADGAVIAMAADKGILPQANGWRDTFRVEWQRAADGRQRPPVACPPRPTTCATATSAVFRLRKHPPGGFDEDRVFWRFSGAGEDAPPPDPTGGALYQLCIYGGIDGVVQMDVGTPAAPACPSGGAACWQTRGVSAKLRDPQGGLTTLNLRVGADATRILARGAGPLLDAPYLPIPGTSGLTVQLQDATSGRCWTADFPASAIKKNFGGTPVDGTRDDGWLVAELR